MPRKLWCIKSWYSHHIPVSEPDTGDCLSLSLDQEMEQSIHHNLKGICGQHADTGLELAAFMPHTENYVTSRLQHN